MATPRELLFKCIITGDSRVGKSQLLRQFTCNEFKAAHDPTIGVEFNTRVVTVDSTLVKLQVWDTSGQERFRSIMRAYYRGARGALVVFDVARRDTFEHVATWLHDLHEFGDASTTILLIGNKCDLADQREVSTEEAMAYARERGLTYMETSAKTAQNVERAFLETAHRIIVDDCGRSDRGVR
jgi:Ras-related protein Rab-2A